HFSANLNSPVAVSALGPDGVQLNSRVAALMYYDYQADKRVIIAETKDSTGEVWGSNQVIYPDGFAPAQGADPFRCDVRYTHSKAGREQDLILRQRPPLQESFGLNPLSTRLEVWTEVLDVPEAKVEQHIRRGWLKDKVDGPITLGKSVFAQGAAFALGNE